MALGSGPALAKQEDRDEEEREMHPSSAETSVHILTPSVAVWFWLRALSSLRFSCLIYEMGISITSKGFCGEPNEMRSIANERYTAHEKCFLNGGYYLYHFC